MGVSIAGFAAATQQKFLDGDPADQGAKTGVLRRFGVTLAKCAPERANFGKSLRRTASLAKAPQKRQSLALTDWTAHD
jgi:hypothetical protein